MLLTGHSGFKGSWLATWLTDMGSDVMGLSLPGAVSRPSLWDELDLRITEVRADLVSKSWQAAVSAHRPQVILHLAAQALVAQGFAEPGRTYTTNIHGTVRMMELLDQLDGVEAALMVTTDKVYDTRQPLPFTEESFIGGRDPYSASKAAMELVVQAWPRGKAPVATARAGNVIGGGDWAAHRLLPDLVRSWSEGGTLALRNPEATRPWQHVLEPLRGYLLYVEDLADGRDVPSALNLGPSAEQVVTVEELVEHATGLWASLSPGTSPAWQRATGSTMVESAALELDSAQARQAIQWVNAWDWRSSVERTLQWYVRFGSGMRAVDLVREDLSTYSRHIAGSDT